MGEFRRRSEGREGGWMDGVIKRGSREEQDSRDEWVRGVESM